LLPLCLRETTGKPVEHNQRGQLLSIITTQSITVFQKKLFPAASSVKAALSITVDGQFSHTASGGNKILRITEFNLG